MSDVDKKTGVFSGVKATWENPKSRKVMLSLGGGFVIVLAVVLLMPKGGQVQAGPAAGASLEPPPAIQRDANTPVSKDFQALVDRKDAERAAAAASSTLVTVLPSAPVMAGLTDPRPVPPQTQGGAGGAPGPAVGSAEAAAAAQAAAVPVDPVAVAQAQVDNQARVSLEYKLSEQYFKDVLDRTRRGEGGMDYVVPRPAAREPGGADAAVGSPSTSGGQTLAQVVNSAATAKAPAKVLYRAGHAAFGTLVTAVNSDYSGEVVAMIHEGPLKGARVIGGKSLEYDAVVVRFTSLSPANGGPAIPINAYAINLGDAEVFGTTGIQGEVDYHAFERYFLPAVLAFGQSYGYAAGVTSQTQVVSQTSTSLSQEKLSDRDRAAVALGGALAPLAADLQRQATRPKTVRTKANTEVGILFVADVTDKAAERAEQQAARGEMTGQPYQPAARQVPQAVQPGTQPGVSVQQGAYSTATPGYAPGSVYAQPGFTPRSGYPGTMAPPVATPVYPR